MDPKEYQNNTPSDQDSELNPVVVPRGTINVQDALAQSEAEAPVPKISTVRTFQSDVAHSVKSDNVSMIKIALAEKERRDKEGSYFDVETPKKSYAPKIFLILGIFILIALGVGFTYWYFNRPPAPTLEQQIVPREPQIVYSETQTAFSVTNRNPIDILQELRLETSKDQGLGILKRILLTDTVGTTTKNIDTQTFLSLTRSRAPESLRRVLAPYFFLGSYSVNPHDVILIFKTDSYETAYPSMLEWEQTLETDLGPLFFDAIQQAQTVSVENSTTTAEEGSQEIPSQPQNVTRVNTTADSSGNIFKDRIIQNKDVRALVNPEGQILFLYTFLDRQTIVMASGERGLKELITRSTTGRIRR